MSTQHTPGPWAVRSGVAIDDSKGRWLGSMARSKNNWITEGERQANAAFIVRACNAHDELVATLRAVDRVLVPTDPSKFSAADERNRIATAQVLIANALAKVRS